MGFLLNEVISKWIAKGTEGERKAAKAATQCEVFDISNVVTFLQKTLVPDLTYADVNLETDGFKLPYPHTAMEFDFSSSGQEGRRDLYIFEPERPFGEKGEYNDVPFYYITRIPEREYVKGMPLSLSTGKFETTLVCRGNLILCPGNIAPMYMLEGGIAKSYENRKADFANIMRATLWHVHYAVQMLGCKNIRTREKSTHEGLTKRERKAWTTPPEIRYRVLDVDLVDRIASGKVSIDSMGGRQPLHKCRGHFKTYTAEKPLLGKHVGKWWWNATMKGTIEAGAVEKSYNVKEGE